MPGPSLERIGEVVKLLDHPELTYPTVHVTGTNGKTTTARLITALACAHGFATGTYTSPHLESITERMSICGRSISEEDFAETYAHLLPFLELVDERSTFAGGIRVTYFETLTALAFLWFADAPVGLGVFEVGMGGTWDATNLVRGDVAVIGQVGLDHKVLGSTVGEVTSEKAGIIKERRTAIIREQRPEAMAVIERRAEAVAATLLLEGRDWALGSRAPAVGGQSLSVRGAHAAYDDLFVPLFGEPSARNAAASIAAMEALLGRSLDDSAVRQALASASSPGRVEVMSRHPLIVLDGAHNPDAAGALVDVLRESFVWRRLHLVMACFVDKDVEALGAIVGPLADRGYVSRNSGVRSAPPERVEASLRAAGVADVASFATVPEALEAARAEADEDDLILVTGSFYTVADARPQLAGA
jgi:dihydrofolate synthase/folylpolyglutamate synthase